MPVDVVTGSPIVATERARFRLGSGIEIAYRIDRSGTINVGARPWLVFAHALGCDLGQWEPQIAKFAPAFNILRYDLRGHGESSAPKSGYGFDLHAEDLRGMLDAIGITQAHFVGSSLGGVIGQFAALRFPLRIATPEIKRQMLETSQQMREAAGAPTALQAMLTLAFTNLFRTRSVEAVTAISRALRSTPVDGYVGCARALAEVDLTARLTSINCPVAVIAGAGDRHMPAILGEEIARAVPGARLRVLPNAANLMNVEQADAVNTVLADFLIGLSRLP
jgi:3-oxoadipate enol-lactonase